MGVVKVYCDKSHVDKEERYEGVSAIEVELLQQDPDIEVVEVIPYGQVQPMEGMPPELGQQFEVVAKRREERMEFKCEGVPPEEIRIAKDCRNIADVEFIAHEVQRTRSDLISEGWPRKEVDRIPTGNTAEGEWESDQRHDYDGSWDDEEATDKSQEKVTVTEAYLRIDHDGDGVAEFRRVLKAGTYIHENEVTDDHPFAVFSPILMPYKLIGLSFYDLIEDLQRIKTALTRQVLDNVYLSNNPRTEVVDGQVNLDDLLNPKPGGMVRVKQLGATREIAVPFVAGAGLQLIEFTDQTRDTRTGVTEMNSALNAESLAKGAVGSEGVQSLMQAGAQRQKLIARVLAETGLKRMYLLMLKNVTQYQDRPQQMKVSGRWLQIDPREWRNTYRVTVKVGLGAHDKAQEVANINLIGMAQEKLFQAGLVTPENMHYTATRLVQAMGYSDPDKFFSPPNPNPPPPQPDPAVQLEQMKQQGAMQLEQLRGQTQAQLAQVKSQTDVQTEQMKQQAQDAQMQRELQMQAERDAMKMRNEMELEQFKAQLNAETERYKAEIQRQTQLDLAQLNVLTRPEPRPNE